MNFTLKLPQNRKNLKQILTRLEIYFWASLITLMGESVLVQRVLQKVYNFDLNRRHVRFLLKAIALSAAGVILGFMVGLLSAQ
jgi:hypothetical protein